MTTATLSQTEFDVSPRLERKVLAERFGRDGRLHIPDFLDGDGASRLHENISRAQDWVLAFNRGNSHFQVTRENLRAMPQQAYNQLMADLMAEARDGFQLVHDMISITINTPRPVTHDPLLLAFHAFTNSPAFLDFIHDVTGLRGDWTSGMASRYGPGHFCEAHNDQANDGHRLVAYVLNLSPRWRADWGGILQFIDSEGNISAGFTPRFNALNLFRIPQQHAVSVVAPFAADARYSITGWVMRSA